ncbi:DUF6916 family protein [Bradyrhizobium guangzhouense]|uniref:DUF6916 domain-containing protein n=2 Tax=Bradyrhizobium guangzhouense TaxID=1325095 RepID=A0AAE5X0K9_9BRAD|nr:hypothetical protein [Bradyrhizobium guangzhouense]QAU46353.1 hypothetical protein XH91_13940 [Bradyrhizobium guangzhouense]RXH13562.1 hypothetical protein EAS54_24020 [Bradyrhizobium guangzhouense]RXH15355.1 hypothetical protein EAS56_08920 [Bradyrhizobium guangzhouense]
MTSSPQHEDFTPHLHKLFRFEGHHHPLRLAQIDVSDLPHSPELTHKPFTLVFHGPRQGVMPEGFYAAEVEDGPRFDLYVIPIHTRAPDRQDYQAVFN